MIKRNVIPLYEYLGLTNSIINLSFDDYYYYDNTLINLKSKLIYRNIYLESDKLLSEQIKHPIIIPDQIMPQGKPIPILKIIHEKKIIYEEALYQNYMLDKQSVIVEIPRGYYIAWRIGGTGYCQQVSYNTNIVNIKGEQLNYIDFSIKQ